MEENKQDKKEIYQTKDWYEYAEMKARGYEVQFIGEVPKEK